MIKKDEKTEKINEKALEIVNSNYDLMKNARNPYDKLWDECDKLVRCADGRKQTRKHKWQSKFFVPYIPAIIDLIIPRLVGKRPSATVSPRKPDYIENAKKITEPFYMAEQATASFFNNMNNAIDNFVDTGKFKFADFARSVIADIAKIALKAAATKIFSSIFGGIFGIPGLAAGGPTMAGKPYLVGEQGPELFVPNSAGSIMTNASLNKNEGLGQSVQPVVNNTYITNNISAIDSRSVAQMFVENRKSLLGASMMARKEMPYGS
jgi:hypothetical protein